MKFLTILKDTDKLFKDMEVYLQVHESSILPDVAYERFVSKLAEKLKCSESVMTISCLSIKSVPFTRLATYSLFWRLMANKDRLLAGYPVLCYPKYTFSRVEEVRYEAVVQKGGKYKTTIRVLTGPYAFGTFTCKFSDLGLGLILSDCGYKGRNYVVGRKDACLRGLLGKAELISAEENPNIFSKSISDTGVIDFNRKRIIRYRNGNACCPFNKGGACMACSMNPKECWASYKECKYYD